MAFFTRVQRTIIRYIFYAAIKNIFYSILCFLEPRTVPFKLHICKYMSSIVFKILKYFNPVHP